MPDRLLVKMLPDYARPRVYALNQAGGTVLMLNPTNGAILNEIAAGLNPTDMAITPAGDALFVINNGQTNILKINLDSFSVVGEKSFMTSVYSDLTRPLRLVAGNSGKLWYTDGAWAPQIFYMNYNTGTNMLVFDTGGNNLAGAGGMAVNRNANMLYVWRMYGWNEGSGSTFLTRFAVNNDGTLIALEASSYDLPNSPRDTPVFLDINQKWVFAKNQILMATNVAVGNKQLPHNIYAISLDGTFAFGPTSIINTAIGAVVTNFPQSSTVQTLSGDQKRILRFHNNTRDLVVYDLISLLELTGPDPQPTPKDKASLSLPLSHLSWTVSPLAIGYDVFFGTNQTRVASATRLSPEYKGRLANSLYAFSAPLVPGQTYYWRVDVVGLFITNTGPVWSFTISPITITPTAVEILYVQGYGVPDYTINLTNNVAWRASVGGSNWLTISPTNGIAPGSLALHFDTVHLPSGNYSNSVILEMDSVTLTVPVTLKLRPLNISKMTADRNRPYLYGIQPPAQTGENGFLLFIDAMTGNVTQVLEIGNNPVDLTVNDAEARLYVASWLEPKTYVVDLHSQRLLPPLNLGTDVYKINAGRQGRIITEGMDQVVYATLVDTTNGEVLSQALFREGDGEFDPTGRFYYHVDNNSSGARIYKFDTLQDGFNQLAASSERGSYFGSRNLVMSADGSRLVWTRMVFDANLLHYGLLPNEIYSLSTNGRIAFGVNEAYDTQTRELIHKFPTASSVSVVDGANEYYWYFANGVLERIPLTIIQAPQITVQPTNRAVQLGRPLSLAVTAIGMKPLLYQWRLNGVAIADATNSTFFLPELQNGQEGVYEVVVFNAYGTATSTTAQVTLLIPPAIVAQPMATNVLAGQLLTLNVEVQGTSPLSYRWLLDNSVISGATNAVLAISNAQFAHQGIYRVIITNSVGAVTSAPTSVRVIPAAPLILSHPVSASVYASGSTNYYVWAAGTQPMSYQWFFNHQSLGGANTNTLGLTNIQAANEGSYYVVISNASGMATSEVAMLTVLPMAPYFTKHPTGALVNAGASLTLTALAAGTEPISYQWQHNGTNVAMATNTSLLLYNLTLNDSGNYAIVASNTVGVVTSAVAEVVVHQKVVLTTPLVHQMVERGDTVTLNVSAAGTPPISYAWQFNGAPLAEGGDTLTLTNIQPHQTGFYRVVINNPLGSITNMARVSVVERPSSVITWGDNLSGQCDVPLGLTNVVAVAGGDFHSLALRRNGTLAAWGYNGDGRASAPVNPLRFVAIAAGGSHNLALTERGNVVAWGRNNAGQTTVPAAASNLLAIAAGEAHSLALRMEGTLLAWGDNSMGQISIPQGLNGVKAIAAGRKHSLALRTNGIVIGWGYNLFGQASPPSSLTNAVAIAAGYLHSVALRADGTVISWGDNNYGQTNVPDNLTNVVGIAAGDFHTYARLADGSLVGWGDDFYGQLEIPPFDKAVAVASGYYHGLALVPPSPALRISLDESGLILEWQGDGVLQWSPTITGPFQDMPLLPNGRVPVDLTVPSMFFRVRR